MSTCLQSSTFFTVLAKNSSSTSNTADVVINQP